MAIQVRKKENESSGSMLFRFNKKVQQSGVLKEARKGQFHSRAANPRKRRLGALHRLKKQKEIGELKRHGYR